MLKRISFWLQRTLLAPFLKIYFDYKFHYLAKKSANNQNEKPLHQRFGTAFMPFGDLRAAELCNVDVNPIRFRAGVGRAGSMDYLPVMDLPQQMSGGVIPSRSRMPMAQTGSSHKMAITFDGVDSQVQFPPYLFQHTIFLWIQTLLEYTSYLDAKRECNPLYNALAIYQKQMEFAEYGVYLRDDESDSKPDALEDDELDKIGAGFFKKRQFKEWRAIFNDQKFILGNVYISLTNKYFALDGRPFQPFGILPAQYMVPNFAEDLSIQAYFYRPGIKVYAWQEIDPEDLIHFRAMPNPRLPILGMGVVEANRNSIQTWLDLKSLAAHMANNGVFPSGVISARENSRFNADDMKDIENKIKAMNSGKGQYNKALIIPSAAEWQEIKNGMDMETITKVSSYCDSLVYSAFEIPPHFWVQSAEHEPKFANMEAALNIFRQGPINSAWLDIKDVADEILKTLGLADKYEFRYAMKYESTRADMLADVINGLMRPEEYRERVTYGFDPDNSDLLKQYHVPNTTVALQHALNNAPVVVPTKPEAGAGPGNAANKPNTVPMGGDAATSGQSKLMAGESEKGGPGSGRYPAGSGKPTPEPYRETVGSEAGREGYVDYYQSHGDVPGGISAAWRDIAARTGKVPASLKVDRAETGWRTKAAGGFKSQPVRGPITPSQGKSIAEDVRRLTVATATHHAAAIKAKIKDALKAQHDRIKAKLSLATAKWEALPKKNESKKAAGVPRKEIKVILADVFDDDSENSSIGDTLQSAYAAVTPDATENMTQTFGMKPDKLSDTVSLFGRDNAPVVNDTTKQALEDYLKDAADKNLTLTETANGMADEFAFSDARAEMISRTEIKRALDLANTDFMKNSGVVKTYQVIGCTEPSDDPEYCNREGILPEELDSLEPHPNCGGTLVPESFNDLPGDENADD